jgi:hypothetical protein
MKCKAYNGEVRSSEKDFETLQLGAFATPGLLFAQGPEGLHCGNRVEFESSDIPPASAYAESFANPFHVTDEFGIVTHGGGARVGQVDI